MFHCLKCPVFNEMKLNSWGDGLPLKEDSEADWRTSSEFWLQLPGNSSLVTLELEFLEICWEGNVPKDKNSSEWRATSSLRPNIGLTGQTAEFSAAVATAKLEADGDRLIAGVGGRILTPKGSWPPFGVRRNVTSGWFGLIGTAKVLRLVRLPPNNDWRLTESELATPKGRLWNFLRIIIKIIIMNNNMNNIICKRSWLAK